MNILIIGGTSGLGLSLAKKLAGDDTVFVTGRKDPKESALQFVKLDLAGPDVAATIDSALQPLPKIDTLIYAAGFYQEGTITDLTPKQIEDMLDVGLRGALYTTKAVLAKQGELPEYIAITSTSQWTPRLLEPVYTAVKAGLAAFANSLAMDERVGRVLVAGPAGMATPFWEGTDKDQTDMLDPNWVADQILQLRDPKHRFVMARILRTPARVEVTETS